MTEARDSDVVLSDAEIVGVVLAAGRAEASLAREALRRTPSPHVRALAERVLAAGAWSKPESVAGASLSPHVSAVSAELASSGARAASDLRSASDPELDRVYVEALEGQERQLAHLLDDQLIPQVKDGELRMLLEDLRTSVIDRLATAENLFPSQPR
jgi:putative membrane protein